MPSLCVSLNATWQTISKAPTKAQADSPEAARRAMIEAAPPYLLNRVTRGDALPQVGCMRIDGPRARFLPTHSPPPSVRPLPAVRCGAVRHRGPSAVMGEGEWNSEFHPDCPVRSAKSYLIPLPRSWSPQLTWGRAAARRQGMRRLNARSMRRALWQEYPLLLADIICCYMTVTYVAM